MDDKQFTHIWISDGHWTGMTTNENIKKLMNTDYDDHVIEINIIRTINYEPMFFRFKSGLSKEKIEKIFGKKLRLINRYYGAYEVTTKNKGEYNEY